MRLSRQQREKRRLEETVLVQRQQLEHRAEPCELHPNWRPVVTGKLAPPAHLCPYCLKESKRNRPTRRSPETRVVDVASVGERLTPRQYEIQLLHEERRPSSKIKPGSLEEDNALREIDALREEEEEGYERRPLGRYVTTRWGDGGPHDLYEIRGRRGLVELGGR